MKNFSLRTMVAEDIPQVLEIEKEAFPTPWSQYAFKCEIEDNGFAYYLVVTPAEDISNVVGYGGMWIIIDEAHITNVAVATAYRGHHAGRLLMKGLCQLALSKGAVKMTLEVRESNEIAQNLYKQMGFAPSGIRPGYYADNQEDAIIMWKDLIND